MFVRKEEPTNVGHIVDHIEHVARLVGIEHVGIGSDADLNGYDDMPPDQYEQLKKSYDSSYAFRERIDTDGYDHPRKIYERDRGTDPASLQRQRHCARPRRKFPAIARRRLERATRSQKAE